MAGYEVGETDHRDWGSYTVTDVEYDNDDCVRCEKDITVKPGYMLSVQSHDQRRENWKVTSGTLTVVLDGDVITLEPGQEIDIPLGAVHTMTNLSEAPCVVHEIQEGVCAEEDIHRFWDPNGRPVEESDDPRVVASIAKCDALIPQLDEIQKKTIERVSVAPAPNPAP